MQPNLLDKVKALLKSRKFWAMTAAIVTAVGAQATGQIDTWQMVQVIVASLAAFSTGVAIEDAGQAVGRSKEG